MNKVSDFKDMHRGKRLFILASGPSLESLDLTPLRRRIVMGLTALFWRIPTPTTTVQWTGASLMNMKICSEKRGIFSPWKTVPSVSPYVYSEARALAGTLIRVFIPATRFRIWLSPAGSGPQLPGGRGPCLCRQGVLRSEAGSGRAQGAPRRRRGWSI